MAGTAVRGRLTWQLGEVVELIDETPTVRTIVLRCPAWPGHLPGQHVDVRLTAPDDYQAQRSYSIATAPDGARVALTVERLDDGEVSGYLVGELRPGDELELRGPIGGYFVWPTGQDGPVLLVGGGSGVVPLMAMLRERARSGDATPMRLLLSSRSYEQIIFREELDRLAAADGIEVVHTLTGPAPDGWSGRRGRIDRAMLAELAWPADAGGVTYVCGPTGLVETVADALTGLGHDPARIRTERFGPTGGRP